MAGKPKPRIDEVYTDGITSLKIISISDKRTPSGGACWNGICSCGKARNDIPGDQLFHGTRKGLNTVCSCLDCARQKSINAGVKAQESEELKRQDSARKAREQLIGLIPNEWLELPLTAQEGKRLGTTHFFTGIPCSNGHLVRRLVSDGGCLECKRLDKALRDSTPEGKEKNKEAAKRRWADPRQRELSRATRRAWAQTPRGKASLKSSYKRFYDNHRDRLVSEKTKRSIERYHEDPAQRVRKLLSRRIKLAIGSADGVKEETTMKLVGCNIEVFMDFIEMQFEDWMNWDNQGEWHLGHVRPCSSFKLLNSEQASLCHNWRNFQPLSAEENMEKRDDYDLDAELVWKDRMRDL